jgi:hypothetical protein
MKALGSIILGASLLLAGCATETVDTTVRESLEKASETGTRNGWEEYEVAGLLAGLKDNGWDLGSDESECMIDNITTYYSPDDLIAGGPAMWGTLRAALWGACIKG